MSGGLPSFDRSKHGLTEEVETSPASSENRCLPVRRRVSPAHNPSSRPLIVIYKCGTPTLSDRNLMIARGVRSQQMPARLPTRRVRSRNRPFCRSWEETIRWGLRFKRESQRQSCASLRRWGLWVMRKCFQREP